jgi:hypothetical protein
MYLVSRSLYQTIRFKRKEVASLGETQRTWTNMYLVLQKAGTQERNPGPDLQSSSDQLSYPLLCQNKSLINNSNTYSVCTVHIVAN